MRVRVCVLFTVLFVTLLSVAQVNLGVITGTVRDKAGAVVAGATVTAKNVDTSFERTVQTNSLGSYIMPAMPLGTYEVTITSQAFSTYNQRTQVTVGGQTTVDATLRSRASKGDWEQPPTMAIMTSGDSRSSL